MRALRVAGVLAMLAAAPAHAGLFDDDEARARINELRTKIGDAQTQIETITRNQLDFANQLETLRGELAQLRGQIEVLTHEVDAAQKRQQDFYVDLDNRLRALETAAAQAAVAAAAVPSDTTDYEAAVTLLKGANYKDAAAAFDKFIATHTESTLLASAYYWGGYAHGQLKETLAGAALLGTFAERWPNDERAPDALERQADYLTSAKDTKGARAALELLARKYPVSDAGQRAKARLKKK